MDFAVKTILLFLVIMSFHGVSLARPSRVDLVRNASGLSDPSTGTTVAVHMSHNNSGISTDILANETWIPSSIQDRLDTSGEHYLVAATRFSIQRSATTLGPGDLLAVDQLESVCDCDVSSTQRPSNSSIAFVSTASRNNVRVRSSSYIRHFSRDQYALLPLGEQFLSEHFDIEVNRSAFATYQVSWGFNRVFSYSQVVSFYFAMPDGTTDVVSVSLLVFNDNTIGVVRGIVRKTVERDLLRIAQQAEANGN